MERSKNKPDLGRRIRQSTTRMNDAPGVSKLSSPHSATPPITSPLHDPADDVQQMRQRLFDLENRNAALQQALSAAQTTLTRYADLYDFAPVSYFTVDVAGTIRETNLTAAQLLDMPRALLVGRKLEQFINREQRLVFVRLLQQVFDMGPAGADSALFLNTALQAKGTCISVHFSARIDHSGHYCRIAASSIGKDSAQQAAALESDEHFRLMADCAPVLIWTTAPDGRHVWFNQLWLKTTGRRLEQEVGHGWTEGIHPDDMDACMQAQAQALQKHDAFTVEYRLRTCDGSYRHMLASGAPRRSPAGEFLGYVGSGTDITERKNAEEALRHSRQMLRHLVSYQEKVREDERKRIAREIHDDLGQNLLALRIDVSMLHKRTGGSHPKLNERVSLALNHIDATMKAVRAAINNLRPTVLDLGLTAAIEWQVEDFQRRSGIVCSLALEEDFSLDDNCATALFRILQESLNNVLRHAKAGRVEIGLCRREGRLVMKIHDNGVGLYPDCRRKANSFGLIGIEERINALGGKLVIDTAPNEGTTLTISIPLD